MGAKKDARRLLQQNQGMQQQQHELQQQLQLLQGRVEQIRELAEKLAIQLNAAQLLNQKLAQMQVQAMPTDSSAERYGYIAFKLHPVVAAAWTRAAMRACQDPNFEGREVLRAVALCVHLPHDIWEELKELARYSPEQLAALLQPPPPVGTQEVRDAV